MSDTNFASVAEVVILYSSYLPPSLLRGRFQTDLESDTEKTMTGSWRTRTQWQMIEDDGDGGAKQEADGDDDNDEDGGDDDDEQER